MNQLLTCLMLFKLPMLILGASISLTTHANSAWQNNYQSPINSTIRDNNATHVCRTDNGNVEVCNHKYGFNGWLGIAQIWTDGDYITKAMVKLNDSYFNASIYDYPARRHSVAFGEHDDAYAMLAAIYARLDNSTAGGNSAAIGARGSRTPPPPAMNDMHLDRPKQWGQLVAESRDGRGSAYLLDFGGGHRIITFVTWANQVQEPATNRRRSRWTSVSPDADGGVSDPTGPRVSTLADHIDSR